MSVTPNRPVRSVSWASPPISFAANPPEPLENTQRRISIQTEDQSENGRSRSRTVQMNRENRVSVVEESPDPDVENRDPNIMTTRVPSPVGRYPETGMFFRDDPVQNRYPSFSNIVFQNNEVSYGEFTDSIHDVLQVIHNTQGVSEQWKRVVTSRLSEQHGRMLAAEMAIFRYVQHDIHVRNIAAGGRSLHRIWNKRTAEFLRRRHAEARREFVRHRNWNS